MISTIFWFSAYRQFLDSGTEKNKSKTWLSILVEEIEIEMEGNKDDLNL